MGWTFLPIPLLFVILVKLEGKLEGARENILLVLEVRFVNVPSDIREILDSINDLSFLNSLIRQAVTVNNISEFQQLLKEVTGDN